MGNDPSLHKYKDWKDISIPINDYECEMWKKLYIAHCLYSVNIKSKNCLFNQLLERYTNKTNKCSDCSWWKGEKFDPYKNIGVIDHFIASNYKTRDWVRVNSTQLSWKGLSNAFLECTASNYKELSTRKELSARGGINIGEKVMLYNINWESKWLLPAINNRINDNPSVGVKCAYCKEFCRDKQVEKTRKKDNANCKLKYRGRSLKDVTLNVLTPKASKWADDSKASKCYSGECRKTFTMLNRRRHCRGCGKIFCKIHASYISFPQRIFYKDGSTSIDNVCVRLCEWCRRKNYKYVGYEIM
eukprot:123279_1